MTFIFKISGHKSNHLGSLFPALIGFTSSAETISSCSCEVSDINCNCKGGENHRFKRQDAESKKHRKILFLIFPLYGNYPNIDSIDGRPPSRHTRQSLFIKRGSIYILATIFLL